MIMVKNDHIIKNLSQIFEPSSSLEDYPYQNND